LSGFCPGSPRAPSPATRASGTTFDSVGWAATNSASFAVACRRSSSLTMWYRSKTERVLCPVRVMATRSGNPAADQVACDRARRNVDRLGA
jgi:hypothetical protein